MRHILPIAALKPIWLPQGKLAFPDNLPGGHRYEMGLSVLCPFHGQDHRTELWFAHPFDGGPPVQGTQLYTVESVPPDFNGKGRGLEQHDLLADLTIFPVGHELDPIRTDCGDFRIVGGIVLFRTDD